MASLLLQRGADVCITDNEGRTPFEVTSTNEVRKLFLMLRGGGSDIMNATNGYKSLSIETVPASRDDKDERVDDDVISGHQHHRRNDGPQKQNEKQQHQYQADEREIVMCLVCMENKVNSIIFPCKHQACCDVCVLEIDKCPLDRQPITNVSTLPPSLC